MILTAADCTALTGLWAYWFLDINPGVWIACTLVVVFALNCMAVKYFGEAEFYASILKIFLIFGFLLFTFVVVLGGNPHHDRIGFRYWKNPWCIQRSVHDWVYWTILGCLGCSQYCCFLDWWSGLYCELCFRGRQSEEEYSQSCEEGDLQIDFLLYSASVCCGIIGAVQ